MTQRPANVSNPKGLHRPFSLCSIDNMARMLVFQTRKGSTGHLAIKGDYRMAKDHSGFKPERAPQAI